MTAGHDGRGPLPAGRQPQAKKLLVLADGEPADTGARDPRYLRQDAKKAVEELARRGADGGFTRGGAIG